MARGFESKSVLEQQEEAERRAARGHVTPRTAADPARQQARRTLDLARSDVARRHAEATSELQRQSLALALEEIDRQLAALPVSEPLRD